MQGVQVAGGYAEFEGHQTWYRVLGDLDVGRADGPVPLVTLHGGPGATHDYLLSMTDLARGGRAVVFYDQTGNGKSTHFPDRGADFYTVGLFARELDNLISHLGISDRYHVLGQSWGGMLAQEHAITPPPGLRSVILSNTAASFAGFAAEAKTRCGPPCRRRWRRPCGGTRRRGTTDDPEYAAACDAFYRRHLCRADPWPDE